MEKFSRLGITYYRVMGDKLRSAHLGVDGLFLSARNLVGIYAFKTVVLPEKIMYP